MTTLENNPLVKKIVALAIEEDLGLGDITGEITIPKELQGVGKVIAKDSMVVCGLSLIPLIMECAGFPASVTYTSRDGEELSGNREVMAEVAASVQHLLAAERTILNFLQRMSGVATHTRNIMKHSQGINILDTRKTTPGWRVLEKYAVKTGGGCNHRFSLGDLVLVKNNHIDCAGGIEAMMGRIKEKKPLYMPLEVEVRTIKELQEVLRYGTPQIVMLDNMSDQELKESITYIKNIAPQILIEVSGGITLDRFERLKAVGVETVSMGALTTKATNVDISFSICPDAR